MAPALARVVFVLASFGHVGAIRQRRAGCAPNWLLNTVRRFVNSKIEDVLGGKPAHNLELISFNKEIKLRRCELGLSMSSNLSVTGLDSGLVQNMQCLNSECLEKGTFGCKKSKYELHLGVGFDQIGVLGENQIELDLCVGGAGPKLDMEFNLKSPALGVSVVLEETSWGIGKLPEFAIKKLASLDLTMGETSSRYDCGFSKLPNWFSIRDRVEGWCETGVAWTAKKIHTNLMGNTADIIMGLINEVFFPDPEEVPESYQGSGQVGKKVGKGGKKGKGNTNARR